jgi:hypothetical protein
VKNEVLEIRVGFLRVILDRLRGSQAVKKTIKELRANDIVRLEVLTGRVLRITIRNTGEIIEIGQTKRVKKPKQ